MLPSPGRRRTHLSLAPAVLAFVLRLRTFWVLLPRLRYDLLPEPEGVVPAAALRAAPLGRKVGRRRRLGQNNNPTRTGSCVAEYIPNSQRADHPDRHKWSR